MDEALRRLMSDAARLDTLDDHARGAWFALAREVAIDSIADIEFVLDGAAAELSEAPADARRGAIVSHTERGRMTLFDRVARSVERLSDEARRSPRLAAKIGDLYKRLTHASPSRHHLLRALAAYGDVNELRLLVELLVNDPPERGDDAVLALVPLFQRHEWPVDAVFPALFDALKHLTLAAAILDLANYQFRRGAMPRHAAADRVESLASLLSSLIDQLERVEERSETSERDRQRTARLVAECVALAIAIVDALALIGDASVEGKLRRAMELSHRRLRAEAAGALARLKVEAGFEELVRLAADAAARSRALAYLEELGQLDRVADEHRSPIARAEGQFVDWLRQPTQFGLAPGETRHLDSRRVAWPGFADVVDCHFFEFSYRSRDRAFRGVGMTGPVTHAFRVDFGDWPLDDVLAVYLGWRAEHAEIGETEAEALTTAEQADWRQEAARLREFDCDNLEVVCLARFFGERHWVATCQRHEVAGILVAIEGQERPWWFPLEPAWPHGPTAREVYWLYKGRRLQAAFGDETSA